MTEGHDLTHTRFGQVASASELTPPDGHPGGVLCQFGIDQATRPGQANYIAE
jgi:hypothetical protein